MITKFHSFFFLIPSFLALICSFSSFNFFLSLIFFLKYYFFYSFLVSLILLISCSFFWWLSFVKEFNFIGFCSFSFDFGLKFSFSLFICSEVFFFISFFWSFFHFFLSPVLEVGLSFPGDLILSFNYLNVPLVNTIILLTSGVSITIAHLFLVSNYRFLFFYYLFLTLVLALSFSFFQFLEYSNSFFCISDGVFGSIFFMLTGFHGIHVLIGFLYILFVYVKSLFFSSLRVRNFVSFELSRWYWHFVDVVWIFLYYFLYFCC